MQEMNRGGRLATVLKVAYFVLLLISAMLVVHFAYKSTDSPEITSPSPHVYIIDEVTVAFEGGQSRRLRLPASVKPDRPFTVTFDLPQGRFKSDDMLSLQSSYAEFDVYLDGRLIYEYRVSEDSLVKSGGFLIHLIPLQSQSLSRMVEVRAVPLLPTINSVKLQPIFLGSLEQITLDRLVNDLPVLFLSLLLMLFFIVVAIFALTQRRTDFIGYLTLFHMAFLGVLIAFYITVQTWTIGRLFRQYHLLVYVLELSTLGVLPLPLMIILRRYASPKMSGVLTFGIWLLSLNLLAQYLLTLSGLLEMREMLFVTHAIFVICILSVGLVLIDLYRNRTWDSRITLWSVLPMGIGFTFAFIDYIITGILLSPLVLLLLFLVFLLIQSYGAFKRLERLRANAMESELYKTLAIRDALTGMKNRYAFNGLVEEISASRQQGWVVMMDLNNLKAVNDTLGHQSGDEMIAAFAHYVKAQTLSLKGSRMYRIGGDEFLLYYPGPSTFDMNAWFKRLRERIKKELPQNGHAMPEFSFGAEYYAGGDSFEAAVQEADRNMYLEKPPRGC